MNRELLNLLSTQYHPVTLQSALRQSATRQGITRESFAQWRNLAGRYENQGNWLEVRKCEQKALWIHETFGVHDPEFSGASEDTLSRCRYRAQHMDSRCDDF